MFRIDKRNVKIAQEANRPAPPSSAALEHEEAAPDSLGQPSLSEPGASPAQGTAVETGPSPQEQAEALLAEARAQAEALLGDSQAKAQAEAEALLAGARVMADGILQEARTTAEQQALEIRGQAWQAGQQEGLEAGQQEAQAQAAALAETLRTFMDGLRAGQQDQLARLEGDVVELALAISRKILGVAINKDDSMYKALIQNALSHMKREGKLLIRLPGSQLDRLFPDGMAVFTLGDERVVAQVSPDPYMKPGDCVIESEAETVTVGVESQLAAITVAFESLSGAQEKKD